MLAQVIYYYSLSFFVDVDVVTLKHLQGYSVHISYHSELHFFFVFVISNFVTILLYPTLQAESLRTGLLHSKVEDGISSLIDGSNNVTSFDNENYAKDQNSFNDMQAMLRNISGEQKSGGFNDSNDLEEFNDLPAGFQIHPAVCCTLLSVLSLLFSLIKFFWILTNVYTDLFCARLMKIVSVIKGIELVGDVLPVLK